MSHTLRSGFPPPPQRPPDKRSPDLSPKALSVWLKSLPTGFPEAYAEKLLDRVHEINRLSIPVELRLRFFLGLGRQTRRVLRTLRNKLLDVAAPPRKREMELAELIILLHSELALGFRSGIDWQAGNKPSRKQPLVSRGTLLNLALHHLCRSLQIHYLIHVEPSDEIWEKIYALYALAQDGGDLDETSPAFPGQFNETPVDTFKTILLVALSAPQSLRGNQLDKLWVLLPDLAPYAKLLPVREEGGADSAFLIALYQGQPPRMYAGAERSRCKLATECLELDVTPLLSEIRYRLKALSRHKRAQTPQYLAYSGILRHLQSRLGPHRKRRSKRIAGDGMVDVIAGFREVHYFLSGGKTTAETDEGAAKKTKREPRRPRPLISYNVVLNLELVNIETKSYSKDKKDEKSKSPFAGEKLDPRRAECRILNFSSGGYCLATSNTKEFHLKSGELIAVHEGGRERWLPGSVAWVNSDGHQLHFGVKLLAPFCRPGKALCSRDQETHSSECLLLHDSEQAPPSRILLSPVCPREGATFSVESGGSNLELVLQKELEKTPGYVEFECSEAGLSEIAEETVPLFDETGRKENRAKTSAPEEKSRARSKLWKKL